ncbi:hypothetical protein C0068_11030 [Zhongshania marina]|uniref:Uncharacterized protein n=1 Tax=Zhongshania marina TaxID=2304603 RepID=A0A2S4HF40_9GAMM|nr:hypothetical protein C0068_11030 [Marortus luteolus]
MVNLRNLHSNDQVQVAMLSKCLCIAKRAGLIKDAVALPAHFWVDWISVRLIEIRLMAGNWQAKLSLNDVVGMLDIVVNLERNATGGMRGFLRSCDHLPPVVLRVHFRVVVEGCPCDWVVHAGETHAIFGVSVLICCATRGNRK